LRKNGECTISRNTTNYEVIVNYSLRPVYFYYAVVFAVVLKHQLCEFLAEMEALDLFLSCRRGDLERVRYVAVTYFIFPNQLFTVDILGKSSEVHLFLVGILDARVNFRYRCSVIYIELVITNGTVARDF
jgi:hypothetical protein